MRRFVNADKKLMFKEMYAAGTGYVFDSEDTHFEIKVE